MFWLHCGLFVLVIAVLGVISSADSTSKRGNACLLACQPALLSASFTCLPACLPAYLPTCLSVCLPTRFPLAVTCPSARGPIPLYRPVKLIVSPLFAVQSSPSADRRGLENLFSDARIRSLYRGFVSRVRVVSSCREFAR